jgi:hypothetical protein
MKESVDCQVFSDQLERLLDGTLPNEALGLLRQHADACPTCATQLRVKSHLARPTLAELESRVPDPMVETMYRQVRAALDEPATPVGADPHPLGSGTAALHGPRSFARPWVPLLAAASVALLLSTGVLGIQLRRAKLQEARMAVQLDVQRARVTGLLTAGGRATGATGGASWLRFVPAQETITIAELVELLDRVPADRVILSETRVGLLRSRPTTRAGRIMDGLLQEISSDDGIRAGDLLRALDRARIRRDLTVRTADLVELLS